MLGRLAMVATAGVLVLAAAGCGSDAAPGSPRVFAAASLTGAFGAIGGARFTFAGTSSLVTQIEQGAPADVFASADEAHMRALVEAGTVERPVTFARNRMAIAVAAGNPEHIETLADLARPGLVVVLVDPSVPAGGYTRRMLSRAGVDVRPRSLELDVKAAVTKVRSGEADAAVVYATDVGPKNRVDIPAAANVVATYPIAVVKGSPHRREAAAFVRRILSAAGQRALRERGFLPAE